MFNRYIIYIYIVTLSITASENNKPYSLWIKIFPSEKTANKSKLFYPIITQELAQWWSDWFSEKQFDWTNFIPSQETANQTNRFRLVLITKEEIENKEGK